MFLNSPGLSSNMRNVPYLFSKQTASKGKAIKGLKYGPYRDICPETLSSDTEPFFCLCFKVKHAWVLGESWCRGFAIIQLKCGVTLSLVKNCM